ELRTFGCTIQTQDSSLVSILVFGFCEFYLITFRLSYRDYMLQLPRRNETGIHGFNEHRRCPASRIVAKTGVIVGGYSRRHNLLQSSALVDHCLNPIPDNDD